MRATMPSFWDSSSLVPFSLTAEAGPARWDLLRKYTPVVWWGLRVEMASALARLIRQGVIDQARADFGAQRVLGFLERWQEVGPDDEVRETAIAVCHRYALRATDALQLAAALVWCSNRPRNRVFVTQDRRLAEAARQAGFTVLP